MDLTETLLHGAPSPRQCTFHWHDSKLTDDGSGLAAVRCGDHKAHFYTQGDYAIAGGRSKTWGKGGKQDPPLLFNLTVRASTVLSVVTVATSCRQACSFLQQNVKSRSESYRGQTRAGNRHRKLAGEDRLFESFESQADETETHNIDPSTDEYTSTMALINAAREKHLASIVPVCSQNLANEYALPFSLMPRTVGVSYSSGCRQHIQTASTHRSLRRCCWLSATFSCSFLTWHVLTSGVYYTD